MVKFKREMAQITKDKISAKMRGRKLTDQHKKNISNSLKNAWSQVPQTSSNLWATDEENNENNNQTNQ